MVGGESAQHLKNLLNYFNEHVLQSNRVSSLRASILEQLHRHSCGCAALTAECIMLLIAVLYTSGRDGLYQPLAVTLSWLVESP